MAIKDGVDVGVLGVLSGRYAEPDELKLAALAGTILGTGIGAYVDAGYTDEQILALCTAILAQIRSALMANDPVGEAFRRAIGTIGNRDRSA